jgi:hypothetical protein
LQIKFNKSRGKIVQFLAESLKEQLLADQQTNYALLKDSSKYIVECQQTGKIETSPLITNVKIFAMAADKSGDCTFMASWLKCVLEYVPALSEVPLRFYDITEVNLAICAL